MPRARRRCWRSRHAASPRPASRPGGASAGPKADPPECRRGSLVIPTPAGLCFTMPANYRRSCANDRLALKPTAGCIHTTMNHHLLDNIAWHTLSGSHAVYATGTHEARRYAPGFSPIVGFTNAERPEFDALAPYCEPGEHFYCGG